MSSEIHSSNGTRSGVTRPVAVASRADGAQPSLPSALASFLTEEGHASPPDREALLAGNPLIKLLDADPSKEIAVLGAVWVNAPPRRYVEQVKNIEQSERHVERRAAVE